MANTTVYPFGTGGSLPSSIGIINDLKTGGADKALSAEMGKVLGEGLFEPQTIDVASLNKLNWIIGATSKWANGDNVGKGSLLRVIPGKVYTINNDSGAGGIAIAPLVQTSPGPNNGDTPQFATGYTERVVIPNGESLDITMPADAQTLYIQREYSSGTDCTPTASVLNSSSELAIAKLSYPFDVNGWVARSTGIVTMSGDNRTTGLIKIDPEADYEISGIFGASAGLCVFYDEEREYLGYFDETGLTSPAKATLSKKDGSIPSGAVYMRVQGSIDGSYCIKLGGVEEDEYKGWTELPITELANASTSSTGLGSSSTTRVSIVSSYSVPHQGATLKFKLPPFIDVWIYSGYNTSGNAISFSSSNGWFNDGDEFTLPERDIYFRFVFAYRNHMPVQSGDSNYELSVADINGYIENGLIKFYYKEIEGVVSANSDCEKYVKAAMRKFTNNAANDADLNVFPLFIHTSDTHGDVIRVNRFADYADYLGVDAALLSGDMAAYRGFDRMNYVNSIADKHNTPVYICMGNHDSGKFGDFATAQQQYNSVMKYLIDKNECSTPVGEDYPTYYYKDFASKKIRLIVLNSYEEGRKYATSTNCYYTQDQMDWLISTLAATPASYGVVLMYHSPESTISKDVNRAAFYQDSVASDYQSDSITGGPIVKIVDAFINRSAVSDSFTQTNNSSQTVTISYSADFSSLNTGVEFVAHICGHEHCDFIGYYAAASSRQLVLNVTCGCCLYGADYLGLAHLSDLPRDGRGVTQDSFNVYAIDRARGVVKVARIGSNTNFDGQDRKFAVMPYKD